LERIIDMTRDIHVVEATGMAAPGGPPARPARAVVPVPALHYGYLIEIDAVAVRRKKETS
jgi:2-iminobutanoate/2-iminopropanoate deaminase